MSIDTHTLWTVLAMPMIILCHNSSRRRNYLTRSTKICTMGSTFEFRRRFIISHFSSSFVLLEAIVFQKCVPNTVSRPPLLDDYGLLGLVLLFLNSRLNVTHLCMIFGITPSPCQRAIKKMIKILNIRVLRCVESQIRFPSQRAMREFSTMISQREPQVNSVIGFVDGVALPCQWICLRRRRPCSLVPSPASDLSLISNASSASFDSTFETASG